MKNFNISYFPIIHCNLRKSKEIFVEHKIHNNFRKSKELFIKHSKCITKFYRNSLSLLIDKFYP